MNYMDWASGEGGRKEMYTKFCWGIWRRWFWRPRPKWVVILKWILEEKEWNGADWNFLYQG